MKNLFKAHIETLQRVAEESFERTGCRGLVIAAGAPIMKFEDDMPYSFIPNHHFRHWCPARGPHHAVVLRAGLKPLLLGYEPSDFWHAVEKIGDETFWSDAFEIKTFTESERIWDYVRENFAGFSMHGNDSFSPDTIGLEKISDQLLANLNWQRSLKTDFEIACSIEATKLGALGHKAARKAFLEGETEFGIQIAYLGAMKLGEDELPYTSIIGINSNAAVLHYHWKEKTIRNGHVLLIDAGAQFNDYASDITRTHSSEKTHLVFVSLIKEMDAAQQRLCALVKPGLNNRDLNQASRVEVAKILIDHQILLDISAEAVVSENLIFDFYPHGIGHPIGLHVHDVGGFQKSRDGGVLEKSELDGSLRSLRTFENRNYQTVEPGLYFIDMLLANRRASNRGHHYNWKLIETLKPFGGIRIEDDILVTETGHRNLTREYL